MFYKLCVCSDRELFCDESLRCDGRTNCYWLIPDDEENCTVCPPNKPLRCDCNKEGDYSCEWNGEDRLSSCFVDSGRKYSRERDMLLKLNLNGGKRWRKGLIFVTNKHKGNLTFNQKVILELG